MNNVLLLCLTALLSLFVLLLANNFSASLSPEDEQEGALKESVDQAASIVLFAPQVSTAAATQIAPSRIGYKKPNDSAILLAVHELRSKDWLVGDWLSITIPHTGYVLETQIDEVRELAPGVTSVKSYPDASMTNHVLVTISRKNTFMNVFTPSGEYELTGGEEFGWLVPSRALGGPSLDDEYYGAAREFPEYQISTSDD